MKNLTKFYLFLSSIALIFFSTSALAAATHGVASQRDVSHTYLFLVCVSSLFFIGILVAMTAFIINNRKSGLDLLWSTLPAIMLIAIVGLGWVNFQQNHLGETFYAVKFSQ